MPDAVGEPSERDVLADRIALALLEAAPGSTVSRRGSLAAGTADVYSDIDLARVVPDARFGAAIASTVTALATVAPVLSFRVDPDHQRSERRRLLFVRFADVPLFWRLDLEVWASSVAYDESVDAADPSVRGTDWCPYESALMNALGAVKALHRGRDELARDGLTRGLERIGGPPLLDRPPRDRIVALAERAAAERPHLCGFAADIVATAALLD